jgi:multidrug transporter EmrE-like cation transporter
LIYVLLVVAILLNVAGQLLLKRAAMAGSAPGAAAHKVFLSVWFIGGAGSLGASMLLWVLVLRALPLTLVHPFTGAVFILVPLASHLLWKEPLPRTRLAGICIIIAGIYLVVRSGS